SDIRSRFVIGAGPLRGTSGFAGTFCRGGSGAAIRRVLFRGVADWICDPKRQRRRTFAHGSAQYERGQALRPFKLIPNHLIPLHPNHATCKDWLVLLEAGTIVGPSPRKLRVARSTRERKVVRKRNMFLRAKYFLEVDGFDPRIHTVFFCPQLYKYDSDQKL